MEDKYLYWLCQIKNLRRKTILLLMQKFGCAKAIYDASDEKINECKFLSKCDKKVIQNGRENADWIEEWQKISQRKIKVVTMLDTNYPKRLQNIYKPPKTLFVKGELPDENKISIGIVGARNCTMYGRDMARMFGYRLAKQGLQIISGMAKGIDGWGHQGALEAGGKTFAVLGTGVEVCYPPVHESLYQSIQRHGGVISEFPINMKAMPHFFPQRNRIISGLSDGILVVEAREKSGSLITADAALEQGKDVFVIPGRIGDELSLGCNLLIRQGAIPVVSPQDILEFYHLQEVREDAQQTEKEEFILNCMHTKPMHIDNIIAITKRSPTEVIKSIISLCKSNKIEEVGRDFYRKKI